MVFDKSDQHQTVYDSYDVELVAKHMQLLALENEYNVSNEDDKHWSYQMFVTYYCEGCSAAPLTQYKNNKIKQELTKKKFILGMILMKDILI